MRFEWIKIEKNIERKLQEKKDTRKSVCAVERMKNEVLRKY